MKIALIADIHGNLPALEATIEDINKRQVDKIVCLGDIIGKGPSSKETIDICRKKCDLSLQGNWDAGLYKAYYNLKHGVNSEINSNANWYINDAGPQRMEYLGSLPHCAEFYLSGKLLRLFHSHPLNFNRYFADSPIEKRVELFDYCDDTLIKRQSDVAVYADIHVPYLQTINDKILLNVGSVGNPLDITQASYVIVEGEENSENSSSFSTQFIRVPYDIERAVSISKDRSVPDLQGYLLELTTATYFRRGKPF